MAITITDGYMDKGNPVVCKFAAPTDVSTRSGEGSEQTEVEIPFHRHCQKTVCSAWQGGQGLTRYTLLHQPEETDLTSLKAFIPSTDEITPWQGYFKGNTDNITEDLRSILELIDKIASQVATKATWQVTFNDCGDSANNIAPKRVADKSINPWDGNNAHNYVFENFGRLLNLTVKGGGVESKFIFHTLRSATLLGYELPGNQESLGVELPHYDLTINFNGVKLNEFKDICMKSGGTVDINQDFNKLPSKDYDRNHTPIQIDGSTYVYRYSMDGGSFTPQFSIGHYSFNDPGNISPVIQWELHIRNTASVASGTIMTIGTPQLTDAESGMRGPFALTDQMYVEAGKTNVYTFRVDRSWYHSFTYSLAYVYNNENS